MVCRCCVPECREKYVKGGCSFYSFPSNIRRRNQWVTILGRNEFAPNPRSKICAKHFSEDCIFSDKYGRRRLTQYALPTIDIFPTQFTSTAKETRIYESSSDTESDMEYTPDKVNNMIKSAKVIVFTTTDCPDGREAAEILLGFEYSIRVIEVNTLDDGEYILDYMAQLTGDRRVPHVFINGAYFGGICNVRALYEDGTLARVLS